MSSMLYTSKQFFAMFHGSGPDLWSIYPTNEPGAFSPFESQTSPLSDAPSTFTSASLGFLPISAAASLDYTCASPSNHGVSQDNTPFHPFMGYAPSLPTDTGIQGFSASSLPDVDDVVFRHMRPSVVVRLGGLRERDQTIQLGTNVTSVVDSLLMKEYLLQ